MRVYEFRAWHKKQEKMVYDVTPFQQDNNTVVMQYIELKDKNGKKGYQCDWIEGLFDGCYIDWCDKCCQLELFITNFGCTRCGGDVDWWEVVDSIRNGESWFGSNIYQNPELVNP